MSQFKSIVTITWEFERDGSEDECLEFAKRQLDHVLDKTPEGEGFDNFCIQVSLAKMRDRQRLVHLAEFSLDEVLPHITIEPTKREYKVGDKGHMVKMNSDRYWVFRNSQVCAACGLPGTKMMLDINPADESPHFNLYGEEYGRLVLMTKDHKLPVALGGKDEMSNYVTMCAICNNLKGADQLTTEQIYALRVVYNNAEHLPKKEIREKIKNMKMIFVSTTTT